ncbi:MAG: hypothetical protein ACYS47_20375 [Planctomycetota bacterium]|jgi:hypothetical protein
MAKVLGARSRAAKIPRTQGPSGASPLIRDLWLSGWDWADSLPDPELARLEDVTEAGILCWMKTGQKPD